jgi:acetoin utilization protein AcuB
MLARDLMTAPVVTVAPDTRVVDARARMVAERIRHLLVTDGGRLVGIVTDRDIRITPPASPTGLSIWEVNHLLAQLTVSQVMSRMVIAIGPDRDARDVAELMLGHKIGAVPVVDGERVVGIVTETDIVRAFVATSALAPR